MTRVARGAGIVCGLVVVALALHSWAIASTGPSLGTDLAVAAVAPGELELSGSGPVLRATALRPGDAPATGSLRVRNITGDTLRVRIRALPSTGEVDDVLGLRATMRGRTVAAAKAGRWRRWSAYSFRLGVRESAVLRLSARQLRAADGLIADLTLEFDARAVVPR
jgi:hypothetical protein